MNDFAHASHDLVAGYGESVITPPMGVELCGYGFYLQRRAETVLDDLKARAVCVSGGGTTLFLIACDLIGFDVATSDAIRKAIADEHHVPIANVLLACTHTHSGPASEFLRGFGEIAPEYVRRLPELTVAAARHAALDRGPCIMRMGSEEAAPIGYNRRFKSFHPINPNIAAVIFERKHFPISLCAYACHAVTLGLSTAVSADWPGAVVKAMEMDGYRCVCFQGFCGDIDPVCNKTKWGSGTSAELDLYGMILKHHLLNIARNGQPIKSAALTAVETRISLPLEVPPDKTAIDSEYRAMLSQESKEAFKKFADEWRKAAHEEFDGLHQHPYRDNIPIQVMRLNGMNLIALPAEVFCEYGLKLRPQFSPLLTIGYANGNTGYWPAKTAYDNQADYAAYEAPKIYDVFPFASSLEDTILNVCRKIIK
ncbi:MAG: hypothetical protein KKG09_10065 [Verrucomicrobia bacterium]|nr:hypothetical protein [Verrucomicrobiota bacterium]MBU4291045.1 hypothetical protein [Verrucomicrobiota bacterium]MBU4429338.1 hypothetical protein [Verrucomicrobiota bacterium]MBU4498336.1 hypothetical protein [Verrucomicrobiota bacterium]MCG2679441.1 hypothetical protein [Kiritimatiellia bacterium]